MSNSLKHILMFFLTTFSLHEIVKQNKCKSNFDLYNFN